MLSSSRYADQLYCFGPSFSTMPHHTSSITPSTPAVFKARRLQLSKSGLLTWLSYVTASNCKTAGQAQMIEDRHKDKNSIHSLAPF